MPLLSLFKRSNLSNRVLRWSLELQAFNLEMKYIQGGKNVCADTLSRLPVPENTNESSLPLNIETVVMKTQSTKTWLDLLANDDDYARAVRKLRDGEIYYSFVIHENFLCEFDKFGTMRKIVPFQERYKLFQQAHQGLFAGHLCAPKIYKKLRKEYTWPG